MIKRNVVIALSSVVAAAVGTLGRPATAEAANCPVWYQSWCIPYYYGCPLDAVTECNIEYYRFGCSAYDADCGQDAVSCPPNPANPGEPPGYLIECWFSP
jgi:hypothetical protein